MPLITIPEQPGGPNETNAVVTIKGVGEHPLRAMPGHQVIFITKA